MSAVQKNFIAGEWVAGAGEIENVNPSDLSDIIGTYAQSDSAQLNRALTSAREAQVVWAKTGLEHRYSVLMSIGQELIARSVHDQGAWVAAYGCGSRKAPEGLQAQTTTQTSS